MRSLNDEFLKDLKDGILAPLTDMVKSDTSLCLELRGNYINIYYRGGNLMKVIRNSTGLYSFSFDFEGGKDIDLPEDIDGEDGVASWLDASPSLKRAIDRGPAPDKREFRQSIIRDNNFGSIAQKTDYYVCDIEYYIDNRRLDTIAVHWPSASNRRLVFVNVKHGDNALGKNSALNAEINDINKLSENEETLNMIKEDMVGVFNQKRDLGLIKCDKDIESFSEKKPQLVLAFVNHAPGRGNLHKLLNECPESPNVDLCVATASFLGFGLFDQGVHPLEDAMNRLAAYI